MADPVESIKSAPLELRGAQPAAPGRAFDVPPGHPIARFEEDHRVILAALSDLRRAVAEARSKRSAEDAASELQTMKRCVDLLHAAENHNVRQENTLFPLLERHGIDRPPAIMWQEHTDMREDKKRMSAQLARTGDWPAFRDAMESMAIIFTEKFASHTQKEQTILYPAALELFTQEEWSDARSECDSLGYFTDDLKGAPYESERA